jgi:Na+/proline symporter
VPSIVLHLLIPPLVLLASRRFPPRLVLGLLVFSLVPDLDFFVPPHRALLHSVFLPALLGAMAWKWAKEGDRFRSDAALVVAFYLFSHSFMDLFAGGVVPLWPLSDQTFFIDVRVLIDTRTLQPFPTFEPGSFQGVPQVTEVFEFLNGAEFAILMLTLLTAAALAVRRARQVKREVVVVAEEP